jgi:SAM-dependent methyltransferase
MSLYRPALARVHEAGFSGGRGAEARALLRLLRAGGARRGERVLDLGCGPGHFLAALARAGYEAVGVDASPAMLALARRRAPKARLLRASLDKAELPPCAAVTALGEPLDYLGSDARARRALRRVHAALRPGGVLLFDARLADPRLPRRKELEVKGRGWTVSVVKTQDASGRRLTRRIVSTIAGRRDAETHRLLLRSAADWPRLLRAAGFSARRLPGWAGPFSDGRAAFLCRRRA